MKGIQKDGAINPSRGVPPGVDVETEPFGTPKPGLDGPKSGTGAGGEGAYIEFDLPETAFPTPGISQTRNTARIPTSDALPIGGLNPKFIAVRQWSNLWYFWR
jgi:hypothetical protein